MAIPKWLSVFGKAVKEGLQIIGIVEPVAQSVVQLLPQSGVTQKIYKGLGDIAPIIGDVEAVDAVLGDPGLTSEQKLAGAAGPVAQVILQSELMAGHTIGNPDLFKQGCSKVASGCADIINSRALVGQAAPIAPTPTPAPTPAPATPNSQAKPFSG